MQRSPRAALVAGILSAVLAGGAVATPVAHAETTSVAYTTASLNVRSGPGTTYAIIGGLAPGAQVTTLATANGWTQIRFGTRTAYVSAAYLRADTTAPAPTPTTPAVTTTTRVAIADVNARRGPSINYSIALVVRKGVSVQATGVITNLFAQVIINGQTLWVHSRYLSAPGTAPAPTTPTAPVTSPTAPAAPVATGTAYATAALNVRATPDMTQSPVGFLAQGAEVKLTGVVSGSWTQIIYSGALRWVATSYLSPTAPTLTAPVAPAPSTYPALPYLTPTTERAYYFLRPLFPEVTTVYGYRPGTGSDHNVGQALDFMINGYRTNSSVGDRLAAYLVVHAAELDVKYVIWEQRIWTAAYPERGWRWMADRGSDTANHYDHVHISFNH